MQKLEIIIRVTETKGILIGRTVYLYDKPRMVVGFWNNSLVFATDNPMTFPDAQVSIYTVQELKEIYEEGNLQGLVDVK